jgi:hypothetical protein
MLSGTPPFADTSDYLELVRAQVERSLPPLAEIVPGVSPALAEVVARATAKPREHRFASARAFADALDIALPPAPLRPPSGSRASLSGATDSRAASASTHDLAPPSPEAMPIAEAPFDRRLHPATAAVIVLAVLGSVAFVTAWVHHALT